MLQEFASQRIQSSKGISNSETGRFFLSHQGQFEVTMTNSHNMWITRKCPCSPFYSVASLLPFPDVNSNFCVGDDVFVYFRNLFLTFLFYVTYLLTYSHPILFHSWTWASSICLGLEQTWSGFFYYFVEQTSLVTKEELSSSTYHHPSLRRAKPIFT